VYSGCTDGIRRSEQSWPTWLGSGMNVMPEGGVVLTILFLFMGVVVIAIIVIGVYFSGNRRNKVPKPAPVIDGHVSGKP